MNIPEILIKYSPELSSHVKFKKWNAINFQYTIEKTSVFFPELSGRKILAYFTHHYGIVDNTVATMFPLRYPNSMVSEHQDLYAECRLNKDLDFALYIRPEIFDLDDIALVINISHELHHISQYIKDKRVYLFGRIILYFLYGLLQEVSSPIEYDAERKSKIVANYIYGRTKLDKWIDSYAKKTSSILFEIFRDIDVNVSYDLAGEVLKLWKEHGIEDNIIQLKAFDKRDNDEERIIEMYDYAMSASAYA